MTAGAAAARPACPELVAPPHWRAIECLSDVHLHPQEPRTFEAWRSHLLTTDADAVFLLGDLFEVWVGDDARQGDFEARCLAVMAEAAQRRTLFFMAGNRDFLFGEDAARAAGLTRLADPTVLVAFGQRWLLSHGDALCVADREYQQFRAMVRGDDWQQAFLSRPLAERHQLARQMRDASQDRQRQMSATDWADADPALMRDWLQSVHATRLIHGHTHRPGDEQLGPDLQRHVLSDWVFDGPAGRPPRGDVLRITASGLERRAPLRPVQPA